MSPAILIISEDVSTPTTNSECGNASCNARVEIPTPQHISKTLGFVFCIMTTFESFCATIERTFSPSYAITSITFVLIGAKAACIAPKNPMLPKLWIVGLYQYSSSSSLATLSIPIFHRLRTTPLRATVSAAIDLPTFSIVSDVMLLKSFAFVIPSETFFKVQRVFTTSVPVGFSGGRNASIAPERRTNHEYKKKTFEIMMLFVITSGSLSDMISFHYAFMMKKGCE
mmetsp:Transcript_3370/g.8969  ORF Transcript_3370/g.8969 Transcript_3370/m.8969 type:complete len:227 (-) Transcript_3370:1092-1772(-)